MRQLTPTFHGCALVDTGGSIKRVGVHVQERVRIAVHRGNAVGGLAVASRRPTTQASGERGGRGWVAGCSCSQLRPRDRAHLEAGTVMLRRTAAGLLSVVRARPASAEKNVHEADGVARATTSGAATSSPRDGVTIAPNSPVTDLVEVNVRDRFARCATTSGYLRHRTSLFGAIPNQRRRLVFRGRYRCRARRTEHSAPSGNSA